MPDITSGIVLLALGGWSLFVSYQVIRHGRFYWMYPTISGFKRRKEDTISKWFAVPRPEPHLPAPVIFNIFGFPITNSIIASWISIAVLVVFSIVATRKISIVPDKLQNLLEFIINSLLDFSQFNLIKDAIK